MKFVSTLLKYEPQCFMSSIVTVSFRCKERNNGAILSLALSKLALAHGLSAALVVVGRGGSIFGIWKVF